MLLKSRTAIVYGASGAVGGAVAKAFAREGAHVVLAARGRAGLERMAAEIADAGGDASIEPVDVMDRTAVKHHLDAVAAKRGPVTIGFGGISWGDSQGELLAEMDFDRFMLPVTTAVSSWHILGTTLARHMAGNGGGAIIGITANAGRQAFARTGGFSVACAAVEHFLRQLAVENGPHGVRVCWVRSPGSPDAPGVREVWQMHANERGISLDDVHREFAKDTPLRKITPLADVANAAVLLASDLAAGMTATAANATGGAQVD